MTKKNIKTLVGELLDGFLSEKGMELYNVEFQKEGKNWFLRVYIDRYDPAKGEAQDYITTDDCETVSRYLSDCLDEVDPIEQNYYLEVSSPGMDRSLITDEHYIRFIGHEVEIKLFEAVDGSRKYEGTLTGVADGTVTIKPQGKDTELKLPKDKIAKTKLKVIF